MNYPRNITLLVLLAALASVASAQEAQTRSQVEADLAGSEHVDRKSTRLNSSH